MQKIRNLISSLRNMALINESLVHQRYFAKRDALQYNILTQKGQGVSDEKYCDYDIVLSLTTYGRRLYDVALTIESLMEQTMKANRIILWLAEDEKEQGLPYALELLQERGLEIYYCNDIRSYKKLIPTLKMCPDDAIITVDDDVFYEYDVLENLIVGHLRKPHFILAHRTHIMNVEANGDVAPYRQWQNCTSSWEPSHYVFPVGVGGVLYPPHCFDDDVFDEATFMEICSSADDIWFKAMSIKNGIMACSVFSHNRKGEDYIENESEQDSGLFNTNVGGESCNDEQLKSVFKKYNISLK